MKTSEPENKPENETRARLHSRIRMAKQILRPLPRKATLHRWPIIKFFAKTARQKPYLWSFRVQHVSPALYIGCVLAFLPAYGVQLILAFFAALLFRTNLLVITVVQFITNPITLWIIYPFTIMIGHHIISACGLGEVHSPIGSAAYAAVIGGIAAGLATAVVLDVCYRIATNRGKKKVDVRRMLKS